MSPKITNTPTYSMSEAKNLGYTSITTGYTEADSHMLNRVLCDMTGVDHCLIETGNGLEVGRIKKSLL